MNEIPAVYHPIWSGLQEIDDLELFCVAPETPDKLSDFNPIIILAGRASDLETEPRHDAEVSRREREIFNALKRGSLVCITCGVDALVYRVLRRIGIILEMWKAPRVDLVVKRSEFSSFLNEFGATKIYFNPRADATLDDIICRAEGEAIVGFSKKVGKGVLIILPIYMLYDRFEDAGFMSRFLSGLLHTLATYLPRIQYKPPDWIGTYRFPKENATVNEVEELQEEISKREETLAEYLTLKEILWFRNDELVKTVMDFFNRIGIKSRQDEIEEEDFWIVEGNKETVIVEVKGLDSNLRREHISKLDEHRVARDKPDDFPALLVVNSFNRAKSLEEKKEDIAPNVIKKAVKTDVLIVRTLDLCNAYYMIEKGELDPETLLSLIKSEPGWLKVTTSAYEVKS